MSISSAGHQRSTPSVDAPDFTIRVVAEQVSFNSVIPSRSFCLVQELWAVADVHCSAFYPDTNFLFDPWVKLDRVNTLVEAKEHNEQKLTTKSESISL